MGENDVEAQEGEKPAPGGSRLSPALMSAMRLARELLPGDSRYGDPLSTVGSEPRQLVARRLGELAANRPGILKEAGLSALQVWEAVAEGTGAGVEGDRLAIAFTDLVGFSSWALEAGDELALALLRDVGEAIEPPVARHRGEVVKRLGDGMMAVFAAPQKAVEALFEAGDRIGEVEVEGYRPRMRAGVHLGSPRRVGGDFLGVDVNVAARVAEHASGGEVLVSGATLEELDRSALSARKKLLFRAKGVPSDVAVYSLRRK